MYYGYKPLFEDGVIHIKVYFCLQFSEYTSGPSLEEMIVVMIWTLDHLMFHQMAGQVLHGLMMLVEEEEEGNELKNRWTLCGHSITEMPMCRVCNLFPGLCD